MLQIYNMTSNNSNIKFNVYYDFVPKNVKCDYLPMDQILNLGIFMV